MHSFRQGLDFIVPPFRPLCISPSLLSLQNHHQKGSKGERFAQLFPLSSSQVECGGGERLVGLREKDRERSIDLLVLNSRRTVLCLCVVHQQVPTPNAYGYIRFSLILTRTFVAAAWNINCTFVHICIRSTNSRIVNGVWTNPGSLCAWGHLILPSYLVYQHCLQSSLAPSLWYAK